jgi:tRNA(fMet)-specific endonuclease VapC
MDTSTVNKYLNKTCPRNGLLFIDGFIGQDCTISFVSEIELQVWQLVNPNNLVVCKNFVAAAHIVLINAAKIAEATGIRRSHGLKIAGAIIAATAIALNGALAGDNDADFTRLSSLNCINPSLL